MANITITLSLEAFNQKHGEFYSKLQTLCKEYSIVLGDSTPTASAPSEIAHGTSASYGIKTESAKKDYTAHLQLTLDSNGYIHLPIRHKLTMIKASNILAKDGLKRTEDGTYGWYKPNSKGSIDKKVTKEYFDALGEKHELEVK